jgi:general secretion pathway protein A
MYKNFFGFKERPFKLVPNPEYLYLGASHEEALAHLTYAVSQGDGFVEITGEVGTGKTTLCRAFLEGLDENSITAYIFNPKLDSLQLLKTINDEFSVDSRPDNTKDLIDALNAFLMEKKREGKNVILLIDEAQNLTRDVLEQLRLLSNLETTQDKLLQIILVGQPELGELLDSPDLRQLNQRIAVSCHLAPFDRKETGEYIRHRLNIASVKPAAAFTRRAVNAVYQYSGGIARKINIVCDRALLTAFGLDRKTIDAAIVRAAIRELSAKGDGRRFDFSKTKTKWQALAIAGFVGAAIVIFLPVKWDPGNGDANKKFALDQPDIRSTAKAPAIDAVPEPKPVEKERPKEQAKPSVPAVDASLKDLLKKVNGKDSRQNALMAAMDMWGMKSEIKFWLADMSPDPDFFRLAGIQNGFLVQQVKSDLNLVSQLNLPAVLACDVPGALSLVYIAVCRREKDVLTIKTGPNDPGFAVKADALGLFYAKLAYIPWKNFFNYTGVMPINTPEDTMIALKMHIREIGYADIEINPIYDEKTKKIIQKIQNKHGLPDDGLIGPLTKIVLYNEISRLNTPKLGG